jgi:hypothetical protein
MTKTLIARLKELREFLYSEDMRWLLPELAEDFDRNFPEICVGDEK